ncbi:MAG: ABC transporter substrate-binding protein, partial [Micromonosporaceae bacterium]
MSNVKGGAFALAALVALTGLSGCSAGTVEDLSKDAAKGIVAGEKIGTSGLVKKACEEGSLTYYTAQTAEDERDITEAFEAAYPCIKIDIVSSVTGRLYERLVTESSAKKTTADVALLTDVGLTSELSDKKLIEKWDPPSADKYPTDRKSPGEWYSASASLMYFIYNNKQLSESEAPKTWEDLLDSKWRGKISTSGPTIGGTGWSMFWYLQDQFGTDYWRDLAAQKPVMFDSYSGVVTSVARGETSIAIECDLCDYVARTEQDAPLTPVYPDEGTVYVPYPMARIADAPNPNAGELFANWYLSQQGQEQLVKTRGAYSGRDDVDPAKGKPALSSLKTFTPST